MARRQWFRAANWGTGLLAAGLALASAQAQVPQAQDPRSWYVGASTGDTNVEVFRGFGWEVGGSERGFTARGGLEFHRNFELELAALRATDLQWSEYFSNTPGYLTTHTTFDVSALQANAIGKVLWGQAFEGYLKVGLVQYQVDGRQVLDTLQTDAALTRDVDDTGWDYLLGVGLAIKASPQVRVRVEYGYFGVDRDFLGVGGGDDPTIDSFALGVDYRLSPR
jgi:opacity protein-like surface antigen